MAQLLLSPFIRLFLLITSIFLQAKEPVAYLFCHGLAGSRADAASFVRTFEYAGKPQTNDRYIIDSPFLSFDFPDVLQGAYNKAEANFAQEQDIACVSSFYLNNVAGIYEKVVIFGHSRGAATALEFVSLHNRPEIAAVIASAPFDSIRSCIQSWVHGKVGFLSGSLAPCVDRTIAPWYFAKKYNPLGIQPIKVIQKIRQTLPVLLICTREDGVVPYWSTVKLYKALLEAGHINAYLLILDKGTHSDMLHGPQGHIYEWVVHAFYHRYRLPHCPQKAMLGQPFLAHCQPTLAEIAPHFTSITG